MGPFGSPVVVVLARRADAPWSRAFGLFIRAGVIIVIVRVALQVLLGANAGGSVLLPLATDTLPGLKAAHKTALEDALTDYKGIQGTQTAAQGDATTARKQLETAITEIADLRRDGKVHPAWFYGVGAVVAVQLVAELIAYSSLGIALTHWVVDGSAGAARPMHAFLPPGFGG